MLELWIVLGAADVDTAIKNQEKIYILKTLERGGAYVLRNSLDGYCINTQWLQSEHSEIRHGLPMY